MAGSLAGSRSFKIALDTRLHFHNSRNVKATEIVQALGALAQESRLSVFRLLVKRGPDGFSPGDLTEKLEIPGPTLSFHLKELQRAGLVVCRREGRFLYYSANFETMNGVLAYLTENCCSLASQDCDPVCQPSKPKAATVKRSKRA
jgi:ArsR family transcriptional regulator, arsenate/arsenite/antimonite-responsive transcriptional repressor